MPFQKGDIVVIRELALVFSGLRVAVQTQR
jgi:hypothetical protein